MNVTAGIVNSSGRWTPTSSHGQPRDTEQLNQARYAIYKMLSLAYLYPGDIDWAAFISELPVVLGEAAEILSLDIMAEKELLDDLSSSLNCEQVCCEHTMLFINNPNTNPIAPYESVYLEDTIMGRCARLVREQYGRYGLIVDQHHSYLLPDHIALELDFMAYLIEGDMASGSSSQDEQCSFFVAHPEKWLHRFLADVTKRTPNAYFSLLATVADKFFQYEKFRFSSLQNKT